MDVQKVELGSLAPDVVLRGGGEREVPLGELCAEAPLVLIFLRHFG